MGQINWTKESEIWLKDIFDYISQDNPLAASEVVEGIFEKVQLLTEFPELGYVHQTSEENQVRILLYGHYRIAYLILPDRIDILGVFHGALDINRYL